MIKKKATIIPIWRVIQSAVLDSETNKADVVSVYGNNAANTSAVNHCSGLVLSNNGQGFVHNNMFTIDPALH